MTSPIEVVARRNQRAVAARGVPPIKSVPDRELIDVLVRLGMPRFRAVEVHWNPEKRLAALQLWALELDARDGDRAARQAVELAREMLARQRAEELISDDPTRGHLDLVDPWELIR